MDAQSMAQMQASAPKTQEEAAAMQEKKQEQEDQRKTILNQIFTAEAQERLGRIAVVKASFARQVATPSHVHAAFACVQHPGLGVIYGCLATRDVRRWRTR